MIVASLPPAAHIALGTMDNYVGKEIYLASVKALGEPLLVAPDTNEYAYQSVIEDDGKSVWHGHFPDSMYVGDDKGARVLVEGLGDLSSLHVRLKSDDSITYTPQTYNCSNRISPALKEELAPELTKLLEPKLHLGSQVSYDYIKKGELLNVSGVVRKRGDSVFIESSSINIGLPEKPVEQPSTYTSAMLVSGLVVLLGVLFFLWKERLVVFVAFALLSIGGACLMLQDKLARIFL